LTVTGIGNEYDEDETPSQEFTTREKGPGDAAVLAVTVAATMSPVAGDSVAELSKLTLIPVGNVPVESMGEFV
jgi:hypothetical protein